MKSIPKHVAIIPDGNRRWARKNGLSDLQGHMEGVKRTLEIIESAKDLDIKIITFWGFSTENWSRDGEEVDYLMTDVFIKQGKKFLSKFYEQECRFMHLGRKDRLPKELVEILTDLEEKTKKYTERTVCLAIDYGGRDELIRTYRKIADQGVAVEDITEDIFSKNLDTKGISDPDMIIRTSGEKRLSGLMPWQSVYAELFFVDDLYPDFTAERFVDIVNEFGERERRFGGK